MGQGVLSRDFHFGHPGTGSIADPRRAPQFFAVRRCENLFHIYCLTASLWRCTAKRAVGMDQEFLPTLEFPGSDPIWYLNRQLFGGILNRLTSLPAPGG
jgi:hypothetical protein